MNRAGQGIDVIHLVLNESADLQETNPCYLYLEVSLIIPDFSGK